MLVSDSKEYGGRGALLLSVSTLVRMLLVVAHSLMSCLTLERNFLSLAAIDFNRFNSS